MKALLAIFFATVYGLAVRVLFGFFSNIMGIMSISFLILVPVMVGFLTIVLLPKVDRSGAAAFFLPWITSLVLLVVTMAFNMEGAICWIMIFPLFAVLAGIGGLIGHSFVKSRYRKKPSSDTSDIIDWEDRDRLKMSLLMIIPLFVGLMEGERSLTYREMAITEEITIAAAPSEVWAALTHLNEVKEDEKETHLVSALGFPRHLRTTLDTAAVGGKRMAYYEKGLWFEETITHYEHERSMVLDIKTDPTKIPPAVLDEHIVIGGKHVDVFEDKYRLEVLPDGKSKLILSSRFMINTPFNWYAAIWAKYLMADILQGELELIQKRAAAGNSH